MQITVLLMTKSETPNLLAPLGNLIHKGRYDASFGMMVMACKSRAQLSRMRTIGLPTDQAVTCTHRKCQG
jgi:hypothetical protein